MGLRLLTLGVGFAGVGVSCSAPLPVPEPAHGLTAGSGLQLGGSAVTTPRASRPEPESVAAAAEPASPAMRADGSEESANTESGAQANESDLVSLPVPGFQAATLAVPRGDAPLSPRGGGPRGWRQP